MPISTYKVGTLYQPPKCAALEIEVTTIYLDFFLVQINAVGIQRKLIKLASHIFFTLRTIFLPYKRTNQHGVKTPKKEPKRGERANNFLFKEGDRPVLLFRLPTKYKVYHEAKQHRIEEGGYKAENWIPDLNQQN